LDEEFPVMRLCGFLGGLLLLGGCDASLPPVSIASVVPAGMIASQPTHVAVQVEAELAVQVDFGQGSVAPNTQMRVLIGPLELGSGTYPVGGLVEGTLPTVLAAGTYDATVVMGDGRMAVSRGAFRVDAGTWPSAYAIDAVGAQTSGVAFPVTIRAVGKQAPGFGGNVLLGLIGDGTLTPAVTGAFAEGVRTEMVTVTGTGEFDLTASDVVGDTGQSPPFTVGP
jgi:hypothetical protein